MMRLTSAAFLILALVLAVACGGPSTPPADEDAATAAQSATEESPAPVFEEDFEASETDESSAGEEGEETGDEVAGDEAGSADEAADDADDAEGPGSGE